MGAVNRDKIPRLLSIPERSFFLFGPRGVGKSTLLAQKISSEACTLDLLRADLQIALGARPNLLEKKIDEAIEAKRLPNKKNLWVWIDEVQKVPKLLDEVQRLMASRSFRFALSGSSARKLKRYGANLLGGRAITIDLGPFSFAELGDKHYNLGRVVEYGLLPLVVNHPNDARETLRTYVQLYIRQEIKEEGAVRKLEPFLRFLEIAGMLNGQQVNVSNIASEAMVPRNSVENYFAVLVDTLVGHFLPSYRPQAKVREMHRPKFYWFDPGVARAAADLLDDPIDEQWKGAALETVLYHELRVYNAVSKKHRKLSFYRAGNSEIDFIVELKKRRRKQPAEVLCIEVKHSQRWKREWSQPIRSLSDKRGIKVVQGLGVYLGQDVLREDDFSVLPVSLFLEQLFSGKLF